MIIIADELSEFLSNQIKQRNNESNHRKKKQVSEDLDSFSLYVMIYIVNNLVITHVRTLCRPSKRCRTYKRYGGVVSAQINWLSNSLCSFLFMIQ